MRILITGASGFIGRKILEKLQADSIEFVTIGRSEVAHRNHINADLLRVDSYADIVREAGATHLLHLSWYTEHSTYWSHQSNFDWIKASAGLIEAFCRGGGKHVTVSGTCAEYDWDYGYLIEDLTPQNPRSIYGVSKDATRRLCQQICLREGVPLAWARLFFPYGSGEPNTRLLPSIAAVLKGVRLPFGVNINSYRDFLHVTDVANAIVHLARYQFNGCLNISSGEPIKLEYVIKTLAELMSVSCDSILELPPVRPEDPPMLVGNNSRLSGIGWKKSVRLSKGLEDFI